jgi:esterase/lipase superfamily enzyme
MNREYHRWYSPSLGRDMELLIQGHAGMPMVVFPTSMGRFFEYEDRGMIGAVGDRYEHGQVQAFCVDSVDGESWYNITRARIRRTGHAGKTSTTTM